MRNVTILLAVVAVMALAVPAHAGDCWWNAANGNWSTGTDWDGGEPTVADMGHVTNDGTVTINAAGETCSTLVIGGDAKSGLSGDRGTGVVIIDNGGVLTVAGTGSILGCSSVAINMGRYRTGTLTQKVGGTSTFSGTWYNFGHSGTTTVNVEGGTMTFNNTSRALYLGRDGVNKFYHSGGTVNAGSAGMAMPRSGNVSGHLYQISNDADLNCTGTFTVGSSGTGAATLEVIGAGADIDLGGYTQTSVGTLQFTAGSGFSDIVVAGAASFDGTLKVSGAITGDHVLMTFNSSGGAGFSSVDLSGLPSGYSAVITGGGGAGVLKVVPEPATLALLGIGGLGVLIRRRRK